MQFNLHSFNYCSWNFPTKTSLIHKVAVWQYEIGIHVERNNTCYSKYKTLIYVISLYRFTGRTFKHGATPKMVYTELGLFCVLPIYVKSNTF